MFDDQGRISEEIVQQICKRMFLSDFVICNPKIKKTERVENELADTLIYFQGNLICFQVKSKRVSGTVDKKPTDYQRIERAVSKGISQIATIQLALKKNKVLKVQNSHGIQLEINPSDVKKLFGVVILDIIGEEDFREDDRTVIKRGFTSFKDIPTHIFLKRDLELILTEIDTLPDFIKYINIRETLYSNDQIMGETHERDLLALYKIRPNEVNDAVKNNIILYITPGFWDLYQDKYAKEISKRNDDNKCSYLIDEIIEYLHKSIGSDKKLVADFEDDLLHENTLEQYFLVVSELAGFDRLTRRNLAEKFIQKMGKADKNPRGSYCLELQNNNTGIVLYSSSKFRAERYSFLKCLASSAYCKFNLRKVIGISTDNASAPLHYYEIISYENMQFDDYDEICTLANKLFKSPKIEHLTEYNSQKKLKRRIFLNNKCPCGSGRKYKNCCA
ncbi:TPA: SEC-C domain-containing protein [Legionella pneumophila]|nr:SEC-C domain-containing protein [Legionella pneumophila]